MSAPRRRSVLVTGGTSGIGAACVQRLSEAGYGVWTVSRGGRAAPGTSYPGPVCATRLDVGRADVGDRVLAELPSIEAELGELVGFVHSAGVVDVLGVVEGSRGPERARAETAYARALDVHFHGARRIAEALLPTFVDRGGGRFVLVDSAAGLRGFPGTAAYAAAKHALLGWARCLALELTGGLAVASVCPYYVSTPMLDAAVAERVAAHGGAPEAARAAFAARNPGGALIAPEAVADVVHDLLTADPGAANGRVVVLDGGAPRDLPERCEPGLDLPLTPASLA